MSKKILYLDYWTVGINHFKAFDGVLKSRGFITKLVHLGSWRQIERPVFEVIDGIDTFDVRYYKTNLIHNVLEKEKPFAVVILNLSFITDRSIILSCRKLNIKTVYLMHGSLTREEFIDESIKSMNKNFRKIKFSRATKHIYTVLNFLYSTFKFDWRLLFKKHPFQIMFNTFINPGKFLHFPPPSFDLKPDLALVYGYEDLNFYNKRLMLDETTIRVIGNPELDGYFRNVHHLGENKSAFFKAIQVENDKPYVTYIEEGLVEDRIWENKYRINFFREINSVCKELGFHLVIKLHPRTARGPYFSTFSELHEVTVLTEVDFPKLVYFSEICVSHYSTTLIYPILLNKPILVPRWGRSSEITTIYSENEVTFVYSIDAFRRCLENGDYKYDRALYLKNYIPFSDGRSSERIADHITNLK